MKFSFSDKTFIVFFIAFIAAVLFGYISFQYFLTSKELEETKEMAQNREAELSVNIKNLETEKTQLSDLLQSEKERNDNLNRQVESISSDVGFLQKLSKTDKELLQKYSKVYFLNENYVPDRLTSIDEKYLYEKDDEKLIHSDVQKFLYLLMDDAKSSGQELLIISAYRSFGEQSSLKSNYKFTYGSGANKFSADQGYSEHQLGTTIDFTTSKLGSAFTKFDSDPAYEWLLENAYKYGFILSYPKGNSYYQFEPWHWRFVGVKLASYLDDNNYYFYNMFQRDIDTYLAYIFD